MKRSPWIARQIEKDNNREQAFATKADIARLVVESFFFNQIDWEHYDESVAQTIARADTTDSKPTQAITDSTTLATPSREYKLINYTLRNGRRVRIVNGRNDTSQAAGKQTPGSSNEIAGRLTRPKDDASLLVVRNLPAFDVGLDTIGNTLRDPVIGPAVATIDLCMSHISKTPGVVPALYGLVAIDSADKRLRATLAAHQNRK